MAKGDVRPTRDGDQFHYWWAAKRCLRLLDPAGDLAAITVEDPSLKEAGGVAFETDGDDAIDMVEYFGSELLTEATRIVYVQLKHSTRNPTVPWPLSGLSGTLKNFAKRYCALVSEIGAERTKCLCRFEFISNRPISSRVHNAIALASGGPAGAKRDRALKQLTGATALTGQNLTDFLMCLGLRGGEGDFLQQRASVQNELGGYLAGLDREAPVQLKELVTKKATTQYEGNPAIIREDVLDAIGTDASRLFPAECLIGLPKDILPRAQERELVGSIVRHQGHTIIEADGGVGKSIFAMQLGSLLPPGSATFVYDCYGNGTYLSQSGLRHRPQDGLVQIANEMARRELCLPLVPTDRATPSDFMRAFLVRVDQASQALTHVQRDAVLCLVIDAADNSQQAAQEFGEPTSFARDLLRETLPENVRLVALCRPYRTQLLKPPPGVLIVQLNPFTAAESRAHLLQRFPTATHEDALEFHRLSSQNPRVQALVMAQHDSLEDVLSALGPEPTTVENLIESELNAAIENATNGSDDLEKSQIHTICVALATLKPFVPLDVLSRLANVSASLVRSLVSDLRHPLLVLDEAVQFKDEPSENWFQKTFRPKKDELDRFVSALAPLANSSTYAASALPSLMLEAGRFDELVELALTNAALPQDSPVDRRDVGLQRLQFAMKAALRRGNLAAAAKLALKAGGEAAGDERQQALIKANTDLGAAFLSTNQKLLLVSRRLMPGASWHGSRYAYEAALLSGEEDLKGDARSRLRMANQWLRRWSRLSPDERQHETIEDEDVVEIALAQLNVHGSAVCAKELRRWSPREVSFRVGRGLARRLIDLGRFQEIEDLAHAAGNDFFLIAALNLELTAVGRSVPEHPLKRVLAVTERKFPDTAGRWDAYGNDHVLETVCALVQSACRLSAAPRYRLIRLLSRFLPSEPPRGLDSRFRRGKSAYLEARFLKASLQNKKLGIAQLAYPALRKQLTAKGYQTQDAEQFSMSVGSLLPWYQLWADVLVGRKPAPSMAAAISRAKEASSKALSRTYGSRASETADEIALLWSDILFSAGTRTGWTAFHDWRSKLNRQLFIPTLLSIARRAGTQGGADSETTTLAAKAFEIASGEQAHAEEKADTFVEISRAIYNTSPSDAAAYFDAAIEVASKIGQENLSRWEAVLTLAASAAQDGLCYQNEAERLSRCAELTYEYVVRDKHFPWEHTVETLCNLGGAAIFQILARWNDRRFGDSGRLLSDAVEHLLKADHLSVTDAVAMIPFEGRWDYRLILRKVENAKTDKAHKTRMLQLLKRYMQFSTSDQTTWQEMQKIVDQVGGVSDDLPEILAEVVVLSRIGGKSREQYVPAIGEQLDEISWEGLFDGLNLTQSQDIELAIARRRQIEGGYWREALMQQMYARVAIKDRAEFLLALSRINLLERFDVRALLETFPQDWRKSPSACGALRSLLRHFARTNAHDVSVSRYYQMLPLDLAADVSGIDPRELVKCAVEAIGQATLPNNAEEIFRTAGLLAYLLGSEEARDVLSFGLTLLEEFFEAGTQPPNLATTHSQPHSYRAGLAGYVWAALGSPVAAIRWEAAHAVRSLAALGASEVLQAIAEWDCSRHATLFSDSALVPYRMHSRLWFVVALERAAEESSFSVGKVRGYLENLATRSTAHVLIRGVSARALRTLMQTGQSKFSAEAQRALAEINKPNVRLDHDDQSPAGADAADRKFEDSRFSFGIDFGPYWLAPLARVFSLSQGHAESAAEAIILDDWKIETDGRWVSDVRATRGYFSDNASSHSHGSRPSVDDLQFYLAYHAMFTLAGTLLEKHGVRPSDGEEEDAFTEWLRDQELHHIGRGWLADYRDRTPIELISPLDEIDEKWIDSVDGFNGLDAIQQNDGEFVLAGRWTQADYRKHQTVRVASALVSPHTAESLARALASEENAYNYKLPDAGEDMEIDSPPFQLHGWMRHQEFWHKADEHDPWAAELSHDFPEPTHAFAELLGVSISSDERRWLRSGKADWLMKRRKWSGPKRRREHEGQTERGDQLLMKSTAIEELLTATKRSLIIEVQVERGFERDTYRPSRKGKRKKSNGAKHQIIIWAQGQNIASVQGRT